jgi:hypothetical protein
MKVTLVTRRLQGNWAGALPSEAVSYMLPVGL